MILKNAPAMDEALLEVAREYQELVATRGWKRLLDFLEALADSRLSAMRANTSSDPLIKAALSDRWRIAEEVIINIQNEVLGTLEDRDKYLKEILQNQSPDEIERILQGGSHDGNHSQ